MGRTAAGVGTHVRGEEIEFKNRAQKELAGDCTEGTLGALVEEAAERGFDRWLFLVRALSSAAAALTEVERVTNLLSDSLTEALKAKDAEVEPLQGALDPAFFSSFLKASTFLNLP